MTRRSFVLLGTLMLLSSFTGAAIASHLKEQPRKHKVVYHLSEAGVDKARFVLGNIQNTITGVGGAANIEAIELVVHGPALKTFVTASIDPQLKEMLAELQGQGVAFGACGNTMKAFGITLEQLPKGAHHLPQGGVVRIMELVEQGYVYLRP
ncbi:MAG TPA: DsrE family protein [Candidatus Acidoferrum sp.]|jgi:intracellular sulfur oxidation DsrE/DsrF family protein|nr:DsrE family protein [Candidatus Acidoferrum sp.]